MIISKLTIALALLSVTAQLSSAQTRQTREEYIDRYKSIAIAHMERYGIPASITMAQGILESDCGNSRLSMMSNNHFGIKCKKNWTGESVSYDDDAKGECFRKYPSVEASYRDHAEYLDAQPRYDSLFAYPSTDYKSWARGLKAAGYATAPDYAQRLVRIIEESSLYLLDSENGDNAYAQRNKPKAGGEEEWFSNQNSTANTATDLAFIDPDAYRVTINAHDGYNVYQTNGVYYILAKSGDSFDKIASSFRVSAKNLRRFNEIEPTAEPVEGEVIYIDRKRKAWEGNAMIHTSVEGETLYSVSQSYGIRLKSLARLNRLDEQCRLESGQKIKIK